MLFSMTFQCKIKRWCYTFMPNNMRSVWSCVSCYLRILRCMCFMLLENVSCMCFMLLENVAFDLTQTFHVMLSWYAVFHDFMTCVLCFMTWWHVSYKSHVCFIFQMKHDRDVVRWGGTNAKMTISTENSHFGICTTSSDYVSPRPSRGISKTLNKRHLQDLKQEASPRP